MFQISTRFTKYDLSAMNFPRDVKCVHLVFDVNNYDFICVMEFPDTWNHDEAKEFIRKVKQK